MKKRNLLLFCIIMLSLNLYCETKIRYGINEYIKLEKKDFNLNLKQNIIDLYENNCSINEIQAPLNKAIKLKDNNYLFVGISFDANIEKIESQLKKETNKKLIGKNILKYDNTKYYSYFFSSKKHFINSIIYKSESLKLPIIINIMGNDSLTINGYFKNENFFSSRFEL